MAARLFPAAQIQISVWEDATEYLGIAKVTMPNITYPTVELQGVGTMGKIEVPLYGMLDNMTMSMDFQTFTQSAVNLMTPVKHQIEMRLAEEYWDHPNAEVGMWADKFVAILLPKTTTLGSMAPMGNSDASGEYTVYYLAGYKEGSTMFEIDKRSHKLNILGKDYMADVRTALGY